MAQLMRSGFIRYGAQSIDADDVAAVAEVLKSDWLTQGPWVSQFEEALAEQVGAVAAVAFSSGTAALHAAAAAAGLGPGDTVLTSPLSFAASAACAAHVGAGVAFADINPRTLNLDWATAPMNVTAAVAVHYAGLPVDLRSLHPRPRVVIEDAAHALGAHTPEGPVGNCAHSDMAVFSFHPVKSITTGEGGAVTTNDPELAERLRRFRHHGIVLRPDVAPWYYEIAEPGFNYRLTDIQAALGLSQLRKLPQFIERRNELAARYRDLLSHRDDVILPPDAVSGWRHAYHLFVVRVPERRRVFEHLRACGVGVQVHYVPLYLHPAFSSARGDKEFPHTAEVYEGILSLPIHPELSDDEQDFVVQALLHAIDGAVEARSSS